MSITLEKIYTDFRAKEKLAKKLLEQMNWFGSITDFDPKTGAALPKSLSGFLAKVAQPEASEITRDRLWRITEHCRASVERLFHSLNESPRREHALLPVHAVRELDANSFIKLSNRPGRITALHPRYASGDGKGAQSLAAPFLWQRWQRENETVDIELFGSDAVWLNPDATTISAPDLFFAKDNATELFDPAARAFTTRLREEFKNDTLIWLAPDFLNDFELEVIRRNLNARFPNAEPLPRSVAAVFAQADPTKITGEGYAIIVVDSIGGKTTATKLIAKRDKDLAKRLPITKGFYWERCPPVVIPGEEAERLGGSGYDIITLDANGRWHDAIRPENPPFIEAAHLKRIPNIGNFAFCINLMESPVMGGIHLHALQQQVADIPLWRDQIPELSVKVMKDGHQQRFHLVLRGTTVKPIRGKPVTIPVDEFFTLPAGRPHYSFPLYVGDKGDDFGFSARLDSPAFPLENKVDCELNLTFEYGADDPYKLVFTPRDKSFPPIRATWRRTEEITDAPAPEYPQPMTWAELQRFPKQDSNKTSDLLDWVERAIEQLDRDFYIRPKQRTTGTVNRKWLTDKIGGQFTFATCKSTDESVFIHQNSFVHELSYADFTEGAEISFEPQERDGKFSGWKVAGPRYKDEVRLKNFDEESAKNLVASIRKRLYFPVIQVWRDGRSTGDRECPKGFADAMKARGEHLVALLNESGIPEQVKNEIRFLMACMHKDAPENCVQWITGQVEGQKIRDLRAVGFALGDVSQQWQKDLLSQLVANPSNDALSILAYAIWREQQFVEKFSLANLQSILNALNIMLNIKQYPPRKDEWTARNWIRATTEPLELLLGLLRTRASSTPEIKILLQPHQKITKELAKKIERVTEIVTLSNIKLFSRVKINIQKPSGDRTPDLLYALRLYLTGDDGANAIHISSVSDGNTDETI